MSRVYSLDIEDLQKYINSAFANTVNGLCKEKYLTKKQADEIGLNYSLIIETSRWMPTVLSKWLRLKDDQVVFRLVRAVDRRIDEGDA